MGGEGEVGIAKVKSGPYIQHVDVTILYEPDKDQVLTVDGPV